MTTVDNANVELTNILNKYKTIPISELFIQFGINPKSKRNKQSLATAIIEKDGSQSLKDFMNQECVWLKTAKLVRGGQLEASLSLPSFRFTEIVRETWETSSLRKTLAETIFVLVFFEEDTYAGKEVYIRNSLIWKMPKDVLDEGVRASWEVVVDCLNQGKVVKYIGDDGRYHTYFPRTSDGPYVHVRPHAATSDSTLPLPVPDKLTGLQSYPMHSFWLTRSYIQKLLYQGEHK